MAYKGFLRTIWNRVRVANDRATLVGDVTIRESLEGATTSVAEFSLADKDGVNYKRGLRVAIQHLREVGADDGRTQKRGVFTGRLDQVKASSYPNSVTIVATGMLGNLRLTTPRDIDLTGMTDQEAVRRVLQVCQVPFKSSDIKGAGYELGERQDVIWAAGTSGAQMVEELDRVFAYATVENGDGKVERIKYSRVPGDYGNNVARYREFHRGQEGVSFYGNERERGHIDEVINFWDIVGLEYEIGNTEVDGDGDGIAQEGKEGCSRKIWAQCKDSNHKLLGNGVYVHGEFNSDLIQSSRLAKAICKRMMEWYNRESDTERVTCANDARVNVGDIMEVKDDVFGIDLDRRARYLITDIQRDGSMMTLDGIGGEAGNDGSVKGGIKECCGTWEQDGKCTPNEQDDVVEPPPLPDLPELPADPADDWCDPGVDPTCIPNDGGITPGDNDPDGLPPDTGTTDPEPPNTTDPEICTPLHVIGACDPTTETAVTPSPTGELGAPEGGVPQGQITGGMDWAMINQWDALIIEAAAAHGIDPVWLKSMLIIESGGVSGVDGGFGAIGLMQVKPDIWQTEALSLGYDLYTDAGQIGFAAAILGGDTTETAGMTVEEAFLTVYYPVYDEFGDLCLECFGESGHTPQMYLDDIALFSAAINAALPGGAGGTTTDGVTPGAPICFPSDSTGPAECAVDADCPEAAECVAGTCYCPTVIACTTDVDCAGDVSGAYCHGDGVCMIPCESAVPDEALDAVDFGSAVGGVCHIPGWNIVERGDCLIDGNFVPGVVGPNRLAARVTTDGRVDRFGIIAKPSAVGGEAAFYNGNSSVEILNKKRSEAENSEHSAAFRINDNFHVSTEGIVCVDGYARASVPGANFQIQMVGYNTAGAVVETVTNAMHAELYFEPGHTMASGYCSPHLASAVLRNHGVQNSNDVCRPFGQDVTTTPGTGLINSLWDGTVIKLDPEDGAPINTDNYFKVCFYVDDPGMETRGSEDLEEVADPYLYKNITIEGDFGEGHATYLPGLRQYGLYPGSTSVASESHCDADFHTIEFSLRAGVPDPGDFTTYDGQVMLQIWDVGLTGIGEDLPGVGECVDNPGYIPPTDQTNEDPNENVLMSGEFEAALVAAGYFWTQGPNDPHSHSGAEAYDFYMPIGTPIYAPYAGTVLITGGPEVIPSGHVVTVSGDYTVSFVHLDRIVVSDGQTVAEGDLLAYSGATPVPTMGVPHLHLERVGGSIDDFLAAIGMSLPAYHHYDDVLGGSYVPSIPFTTVGYTPENPGDGTWTV